jgi:crotonobetainyl-CoA:carnitine CoA-transferase CaiB-like acyl-CoA transferase
MNNAEGLSMELIGNPIKFSDTPIEYKRPPPALGEHTKEVLSQVLGWSDEAVKSTLEEADRVDPTILPP